eukprot:GEZU01024717.1.p1 GENE.GEZU01024717.1~~GEZU01024717.1.p1  ORF type:complete len:442 (+),score=140.82 GEZU01024717.1:185-1510(+)
MSDDDFIGEVKTSISEIVTSKGQCYTSPVLSANGQTHGQMIIRAEEKTDCTDVAVMYFEGKGLANKDGFFGKSDPYLVISRANEDGSFTIVHKTEVVKDSSKPTWNPIVIRVSKLCNNDYMRPLKIECFDWDSDKKSDFIGEFKVNLTDLLNQKEFQLVDARTNTNKSPKNTGTILVRQSMVRKEPTFLEYITGGYEISMMVAIDFTISNGNPSNPSSLHYNSTDFVNQYESAIRGVGDILAYYDSDKKFPAYGYGAEIMGFTSHCFSLNGFGKNPECDGIDGIIRAYKNTLKKVSLSAPTNFSPVINEVASIVKKSVNKNEKKYFILLIATDGDISDMDGTTRAIVEASKLPLSIIIVGVGNINFSSMNELDGDGSRLQYDGKQAERDIVQFVPFREYVGKDIALLARDTLAELPRQFMDYMMKHGILPPARTKPPSTIM